MRKTLIVLFVSLCTVANCQVLTYDMTRDVKFYAKTKNGSGYSEYLTKTGVNLKIGDKIKIGEPVKGRMFRTIVYEKITAFDVQYGSLDLISTLVNRDESIITDISIVHEDYTIDSPVKVMVVIRRPNKKSNKTVIDLEGAIDRGEVIIN